MCMLSASASDATTNAHYFQMRVGTYVKRINSDHRNRIKNCIENFQFTDWYFVPFLHITDSIWILNIKSKFKILAG